MQFPYLTYFFLSNSLLSKYVSFQAIVYSCLCLRRSVKTISILIIFFAYETKKCLSHFATHFIRFLSFDRFGIPKSKLKFFHAITKGYSIYVEKSSSKTKTTFYVLGDIKSGILIKYFDEMKIQLKYVLFLSIIKKTGKNN